MTRSPSMAGTALEIFPHGNVAIVTGDISGIRKALVETRAELPGREWFDDRSHPAATEEKERTIGSDDGDSDGAISVGVRGDGSGSEGV